MKREHLHALYHVIHNTVLGLKHRLLLWCFHNSVVYVNLRFHGFLFLQTNDGSDASNQIAVLSAEVDFQRNQVEELGDKYRVTLTQLDALTRKDLERQQEKRDLERKLALLQHDLKEAQRKVSADMNSRHFLRILTFLQY